MAKLISVVVNVFLVTQFPSIYCDFQDAIFKIEGISKDDLSSNIKEYLSDEDYKKFNSGAYVTVYIKYKDGDKLDKEIEINKELKIKASSGYYESTDGMIEIMQELCGTSKLPYTLPGGLKNKSGCPYVGGTCALKKKKVNLKKFTGGETGTKVLANLENTLLSMYNNKEYFLLFEKLLKEKILNDVRKIVNDDSAVAFENSDELLEIVIKSPSELNEKSANKLYKKSHKYTLITEPIEIEGESEPNIILPGLENVDDLNEFKSNSYDKISYDDIYDEVSKKVQSVIAREYSRYKWKEKDSPTIIFYKKNKDEKKKDGKKFEEINNEEEIENIYNVYYVCKELLVCKSKYEKIMDLKRTTHEVNRKYKKLDDIEKINDITELERLKSDIDTSRSLLLDKKNGIYYNKDLKRNEIIFPFIDKAEVVIDKFSSIRLILGDKISKIIAEKCLEEEIKPAVKDYIKELTGNIRSATKDDIYELVSSYVLGDDCEVVEYKVREEFNCIAYGIFDERNLGGDYEGHCRRRIASYYNNNKDDELMDLIRMLKEVIKTKLRELKITKRDELIGTLKGDENEEKQKELENKKLEKEKLEKLVKKDAEDAKKLKEEEDRRKEKLKLLEEKEKAIDKKINKTSKKPDDKTKDKHITKKDDETKKDTKTKPDVGTPAHTVSGCCSCCKCCKK